MCYLRPLWKLACTFRERVINTTGDGSPPQIGLHCILVDILPPLRRVAAPVACQNVNEGPMPLDY